MIQNRPKNYRSPKNTYRSPVAWAKVEIDHFGFFRVRRKEIKREREKEKEFPHTPSGKERDKERRQRKEESSIFLFKKKLKKISKNMIYNIHKQVDKIQTTQDEENKIQNMKYKMKMRYRVQDTEYRI